MKWLVTTGNEKHSVDLPDQLLEGRPTPVEVDGVSYTAQWHRYSGTLFLVRDGVEQVYQLRDVLIEAEDDRAGRMVKLQYRGPSSQMASYTAQIEAKVPGLEFRSMQNHEQGATVKSPMAGTLIRVDVKIGDKVSKGQTLCIIEAMKMENQIKAPIAGVISQLDLVVGRSVAVRQKLVTIKES